MQSRKESSAGKKFEKIPKDYSQLIEKKLNELYKDKLDSREIHVDGNIYPEEVSLQVSLKQDKQLKQFNFLGSIDHSVEKKNALEKMHNLMDALSSMLDEYLSSEEIVDFPEDWAEFTFEEDKIWLKHHTINEDLEAMANELLGDEFLSDLEEKTSDEEVGEDFFEEAMNSKESADVSTSDDMNVAVEKSEGTKSAFDFFKPKSNLTH